MSKYTPLWEWLQTREAPEVTLTFAQVEAIAGVPLTIPFCATKRNCPPTGGNMGKFP